MESKASQHSTVPAIRRF